MSLMPYVIRPFIAILCLLVLGAIPARSQSTDLEVRVDSVLSAWQGTDRPGIAVAYFEGGAMVFAKAYGLANLEHGLAWTTDTPSDLGSVSKQFTGFAIALLAEEGALSLTDDIRTYLPEVPDFGSRITIDDLLYHRSGLREIYNTLAMVNWRSGDGLFQEHARTLVKHQERLQFEPGTRYLYNNTEYMLLADIVASVTGRPFHEWMAERIFGPLGMDDTVIMYRQGQVIPRVATSYARGDDGRFDQVYDNSTVQGAGGIYSTVEDMGRWIGNFARHVVGTPATIDTLVTPGYLLDGEPIDYARGIAVYDLGGQTAWGHGGASAGYRSQLVYLPALDRGFVFLTNTPSFFNPAGGLARVFFADAVVMEEPAASANSASEVDPAPQVVDPAGYAGTYLSDELQVFYEVREEENALVLAHRWLSSFTLTPMGDDVFTLSPGGGTVAFRRDEQGGVSGFRWDNGRTIGVEFRRWE